VAWCIAVADGAISLRLGKELIASKLEDLYVFIVADESKMINEIIIEMKSIGVLFD